MSDEAHRYQTECAYWWAQTKGKPAAIREVLARVALKRSPAAVEKLRQGLLELHRGNRADKT